MFIPPLLYSLGLAALYYNQESLLFPGTPLPSDYQFSFDVPFKEVSIPVKGATLNALHFQQDNPRGVIFFLHGNAGNLVNWTVGMDYYQRINYDLFIFDYRGYGKSTGKITSQPQLMDDVRTAWNTLAPQYKDKPIVIYGRSLGTALATQLASEVSSDLLILVSPFTDMTSLAKNRYPLAPAKLLRYPLNTDQIINDVKTDIVFMHGDNDTTIPIDHSQKLQALLNKPSQLFEIEGASHNDIHQFKSYLDSLAQVLPN